MSLHTVTILHISDLHERGEREREPYRRYRVLGEEWLKNLDEVRREGPIDLVCFTGDLADWGQAAEYSPAAERLSEVLSRLEVPRERLFLVPGNHDIDRSLAQDKWEHLRQSLPVLNPLAVSRWLAGEGAPLGLDDAHRDAVLSRQAAYRDFLKHWGRADLLPGSGAHGRLGYRVTLRLVGRPFAVHLIGLDTAWLAGDDADAGKLLLTDNQVLQHVTDDSGHALSGLRLALFHHPLTDLADGTQARRLLAQHVDLLLRGHVHEPELELWADPDRHLLQFAAGCLYEGSRADHYPNSCQVIRILVDDTGRPQRYEVRFRAFSTRGFWHDDSSLYREAKLGRLTLAANGRLLTEPRHFEVPLEENPYFTGRAQALAELHLALPERRVVAVTQRQALSGLGGVGKTQLALAYTYRYRTDYEAVFWLDASTEETLRSGFAAQASKLGLLGTEPSKSIAESSALFKGWLQKNQRWLLVLDNADEPAPLKSFLPSNAHGHILLTSRAHNLQPLGIVRPIEVQSFTNAEAVEFLLARTDRSDPSAGERWAAAELAKQLGELPLALEQAAAFIVEQRMPIADYLVSYEKQRLHLLERSEPQLGDYPLTVATTWLVNFEQIKQNKAAVAALRLCALLGATPIPFELLCQVAAEFEPWLGKALKDVAIDPVKLDDVLKPLLKYALLRREQGARAVSMHRLVQEVVRDSLSTEEKREYAHRLVNAISVGFPRPERSSNWPACERWIQHVLTALDHCERFQVEGERAAGLHNQAALYLDGRMQQAAAEPLFKKAIELRQRIEQSQDASLQNCVNLAVVLCNLAALYLDRGDLKSAGPWIDKAVLTIESRDGKGSPYLASPLIKRAQWLRFCRRHAESAAVSERAFKLAKQAPDVFLQMGALIAMEQAESLSARGLTKEAEAAFARALVVCEKLHGKASDLYSELQLHQSRLLRNRGEVRDAETLARSAFEQAKNNFGEDHPRFADAAQTLALALAERGRFTEALPLFQAVSKLRLELLGPTHYLYAEALRNEATGYRSLAEYTKAANLAEQAVQISQASDENSSSFHEELNELALIYLAQGRTDDARGVLLRSLQQIEQNLGAEHAAAGTAHGNLGLVYEAQADYEAAEREFELAAEVTGRILGKEHHDYFLRLHNLAHLRVFQGRHREAFDIYEKVLAGWKKSYGDEHDKVATCLNGMVSAALNAGDAIRAERYAHESVLIAERVYSPQHPGLAICLQALGQCYQAQQLFERAVPLYERALGILSKSGQQGGAHASVLSGLGACLIPLGKLSEAATSLRDALGRKEQLLGPQHPELAVVLSELGSCLVMQGNLAEAETHMGRARELVLKAHGEFHPRYATLLSNQAFLRRKQGRMDEAIELEKVVVVLREQWLGESHPDVAIAYSSLAAMQAAHGQSEAAQGSLAQANRSRAAQKIESPHLRFGQLIQQGQTQLQLGQYASAVETLRQAAPAASATFGHDSVEHLRALTGLIGALAQSGQALLAGPQIETADKLFVHLKDLPKDLLGSYHLAKGHWLRFRGQLTEAEVELQAATSIEVGAPHVAVQAHNMLAGIWEARRDYAKADVHYQFALAMIASLQPSPERDVLEQMTLANRSQTLAATGQMKEAEVAISRAESLADQYHPKSHPIRISLLQVRAAIAKKKGDWPAVVQSLELAAQLAESGWPEHHSSRGDLLRSLGEAYGKAGQVQKAIGVLSKALTTDERIAGITSSEVRQDLHELAQVERRSGDAGRAVQHAERALKISRAAQPIDPSDVTSDTLLLGLCHQAAGNLQTAMYVTQATLANLDGPPDKLFLRPADKVILLFGLVGFQQQHRDLAGAMKTHEKLTEHYHRYPPQTDQDRATLASVLHGRANCLFQQGAVDLARTLYEESLKVRSRTSKPSHIELAKTIWNLAGLALQTGDLAQAETRAKEAFGHAIDSQDGWSLVTIGQGLATVLVSCGKQNEAVHLISQILQNLEKAVGPDHELTLELAEKLRSLQEQTTDAGASGVQLSGENAPPAPAGIAED